MAIHYSQQLALLLTLLLYVTSPSSRVFNAHMLNIVCWPHTEHAVWTVWTVDLEIAFPKNNDLEIA
jgi:hypothetical protein